MENYVTVKFDFNDIKINSNMNETDTVNILSYYLENNINNKNDENNFNQQDEYFVDLRMNGKNINVKSNTKNTDLTCGIILMALDNFQLN